MPCKLSSSNSFNSSLASLAGLAIDGLSLATLSKTFWATLRRSDSFWSTLGSEGSVWKYSSSGERRATIMWEDRGEAGVPETRYDLNRRKINWPEIE